MLLALSYMYMYRFTDANDLSRAIHLLQSELKPSVLKKYDEEIEGLKKQTFQLGLSYTYMYMCVHTNVQWIVRTYAHDIQCTFADHMERLAHMTLSVTKVLRLYIQLRVEI